MYHTYRVLIMCPEMEEKYKSDNNFNDYFKSKYGVDIS